MKLAQSTIFHTKNGKREEILSYIRQIVNKTDNSPDYFEIGVEERQSIGIKQVKELISWIQTRPYQEEFKLAVILEAEKMTLESQNSLLKVLEEPPAKSYIFLSTKNPNSLIETVRSRATLLTTQQTNKTGVSPDTPMTSIFGLDTQEKIELIEKLIKTKDPKEKKNKIHLLLEKLHQEVLDSKGDKKGNLDLIQQTHKALNANTNTKLLLENLFFNLKSL